MLCFIFQLRYIYIFNSYICEILHVEMKNLNLSNKSILLVVHRNWVEWNGYHYCVFTIQVADSLNCNQKSGTICNSTSESTLFHVSVSIIVSFYKKENATHYDCMENIVYIIN